MPWAYVFAVLSAAERSGLSKIVLHHTDALEDSPQRHALNHTHGIELSRIDPIALATRAGQANNVGDTLATIYRRLTSPVAQSDILRGAILYLHGGIYLDLDTITTRSLAPLLDTRQFLGSERIVWPGFVRASRSPALWLRSLILDLIRKPMRHIDNGWRLFRRIERLYYRGINGAVMGAEAKSPLLSDYLKALAAVPYEQQTKTYALGPELLQELIARQHYADLTIQAPEVFYPLPPKVSEHWFRFRQRVALDAVLTAHTRVVHWYASVRTKPRIAAIDPAYVRKHRENQLYSALVYANIGALPKTA